VANFAANEIAVDFNLSVPMADGVRLATDVFRPRASGRYPVILVRTPYGKYVTAAQMGGSATDPLWAARSGYVVVFQDVRGTGGSEGSSVRFATRPAMASWRSTGQPRRSGATARC
jgi:predicted acyl esterase